MNAPRLKAKAHYQEIISAAEKQGPIVLKETLRALCRNDLFYLLVYVLNRPDADKDWLFDRCREVEASPNGHLDLWAREHYKSTIITFAKTIQDILINPEITIGIFSHTRKIAKAFLIQIKSEFEKNEKLKWIFDDILFNRPERESPKWSADEGIIVKRKGNPKESTIEAWGLVDGQPTSKHFKLMIFDDVVTLESVSTPEQIQKTTSAWEMALNLGAEGGFKRYIGTRYGYEDTYKVIIERKVVKVRKYPATDNGKIDGNPVFMSKEYLNEKRRSMGTFTFVTQMLQDPALDKTSGFKKEWLSYYDGTGWEKMNVYIIVDPAGSKNKRSDYSVFMVIGFNRDRNYYLIDAIRDRLNLGERTNILFRLVEQYNPIRVCYEQYAMQADIEHIQSQMDERHFRFVISPLGGNIPKNLRIMRLQPDFENKRIHIPPRLMYTKANGDHVDFIQQFIDEEYMNYPVVSHDDMLDTMARIYDINGLFPNSRSSMETFSYKADFSNKSNQFLTTYNNRK